MLRGQHLVVLVQLQTMDGDVLRVRAILLQRHMPSVIIQEQVRHLQPQYAPKWGQSLQWLSVNQEKYAQAVDVVSYQEQRTIMLFSLHLPEHLMGTEHRQMMVLCVLQVQQEHILRPMLCVLLRYRIIHEPTLPALKTLLIQSRLTVMSKMIQRVQQNFVLRNDSRQLQLFRVILLVREKWDGMVLLG